MPIPIIYGHALTQKLSNENAEEDLYGEEGAITKLLQKLIDPSPEVSNKIFIALQAILDGNTGIPGELDKMLVANLPKNHPAIASLQQLNQLIHNLPETFYRTAPPTLPKDASSMPDYYYVEPDGKRYRVNTDDKLAKPQLANHEDEIRKAPITKHRAYEYQNRSLSWLIYRLPSNTINRKNHIPPTNGTVKEFQRHLHDTVQDFCAVARHVTPHKLNDLDKTLSPKQLHLVTAHVYMVEHKKLDTYSWVKILRKCASLVGHSSAWLDNRQQQALRREHKALLKEHHQASNEPPEVTDKTPSIKLAADSPVLTSINQEHEDLCRHIIDLKNAGPCTTFVRALRGQGSVEEEIQKCGQRSTELDVLIKTLDPAHKT